MQPWVVPIYFLKSNRRFLKWNDTLYDYNPVFGRVIYCLTIYGAFVFYLRPNYCKSTNYIEQNFSHLKKSEVPRWLQFEVVTIFVYPYTKEIITPVGNCRVFFTRQQSLPGSKNHLTFYIPRAQLFYCLIHGISKIWIPYSWQWSKTGRFPDVIEANGCKENGINEPGAETALVWIFGKVRVYICQFQKWGS